MDQIYKFKKKWISSSVNYIIDRFIANVYYASYIYVSVSRIDFKTLTDQIYKFQEKWVSSSASYIIDRFIVCLLC